ncbi:hypothetical protein Bca4012_059486 [Brassica carinata]
MFQDVAFLVAAVVVAEAWAVLLGNLEIGFAPGQAAMNITSQAGQSVSDALALQLQPLVRNSYMLMTLTPRIFIGSPSLQQKLKEHGRFSNTESERELLVVSSLTKVCKFLDISAQQRKLVRSTVCSQVLVRIIGFVRRRELNFMDVLDMVNDLRRYLLEHDGFYHLEKLLSMKEGLLQIKDVFLDNAIGFREVRHQEHLVYRKLSKMFGKSFAVSVHSPRVFPLWTSDEKMLGRGIKLLDRALGLFESVWETAGMKESINLQGHLWCLGAEERTLIYRGKTFFLHDLSL